MKFLVLTVALFTASPAWALDVPHGSPGDARVKVVNYDEGNVVAVYSYEGMATHIVFAPGEEVQAAASGFSGGWEVVSRGNNLYLKPKSLAAKAEDGTDGVLRPVPGRWDTNLAVTTNRRAYSFQLFLVPPRSAVSKQAPDDRVAFRLTFRYPDEARAAALARQEEGLTQRRLATAPAIRNSNYQVKANRKSRSIAPTSIFDDGRFTHFSFPANQDLPTVYVVDASGQETLVNTHVENSQVVAQRTSPRFSLRLGKLQVDVINKAFDPSGAQTANGTTSPNVQRVVQGESL